MLPRVANEIRPEDPASAEIWTIGHWTCPEPDFLRPLQTHDIDLVADVRAQPGSRRNPQFNHDVMPGWLGDAGIAYQHLPLLAGRRPRQSDIDPVLNVGWRNRSFKNYADYTLTSDYERGIKHLTELAAERRVVILCGEPMPWRCHRLLIANTLTAAGWTVSHLYGDDPPRQHELGGWGATPHVDDDGRLIYPLDD